MTEISERIVARIRTNEDGSLSNPKVELYALLRAEQVVTPNAAWTIIMKSGKGHLPSGKYQASVHQSPAFKRRLEYLMEEKADLEAKADIWADMEWQAKQSYRRACALNEPDKMMRATDQLMKIAMRGGRAPANGNEGGGEEKPKGDRGAPAVPTPNPADLVPDFHAAKLLER